MIYVTENEKHFEPCPCCGESDVHWEEFEFPVGERIRRHCRYCGMSTGWHKTDAEAREQWNTRYNPNEKLGIGVEAQD